MKRTLPILTAVVGFACVALGQTPSPAPTPLDDVVKISTNLIQIDVTVTDKKGKPVTDLKEDEVAIYENGVRQSVTNFSFVSAAPRPEAIPRPSPDAAAPPTAVSTLRPEQIRRTIALVVDDLSLSFNSAYQTRRALKKFVDEQMHEGDLVAILRTGAGVGALQQFTSDKRILYAAIERVKWNALGSGGVGVFAPIGSSAGRDPDDTDNGSGERAATDIERDVNDFRTTTFATGTLGALAYIIRGMSQLPGRKSVMLFSDGFRLSNIDAEGFETASDVLNSIRRLAEAANRASVVLYTLDPRGLVVTGMTAADNTSGLSMEEVQSELSSRASTLRDTQDSLRFIAEQTGGIAFINNNDLVGGVRRVLDDQSYYLVGYDPGEGTFDAAKRKFNKLEVRVNRPGVIVRYRSGFFNVADNEQPRTVQPSKRPPIAQLQAALTSPFGVSDISVRLNALFGNEAEGSFVRSLLHVNARDLKFTDEKNSEKKAVIEVLAMCFGDNGQIVEQLAKGYTLTLDAENYKAVMADGFVYHFTFPINKPGAYQYRVAVRDAQGGGLGSASQFIEVPNLKKDRAVISSIILESLSPTEWAELLDSDEKPRVSDAMSDTAARRIRRNTVLRYGFEVYSAKLNSEKRPALSYRVRIFRDNKLILDGKETAIDSSGQSDPQRMKAAGALAIGQSMVPGDYVLQLIVKDRYRHANSQPIPQFVQFEVVE
jgi:VWFA-related protein